MLRLFLVVFEREVCYHRTNNRKGREEHEDRTQNIHPAQREVLTVRSLCADDAEALNAFRYATYSETYFMARYPEEGANLEAMGNRLADWGKAL